MNGTTGASLAHCQMAIVLYVLYNISKYKCRVCTAVVILNTTLLPTLYLASRLSRAKDFLRSTSPMSSRTASPSPLPIPPPALPSLPSNFLLCHSFILRSYSAGSVSARSLSSCCSFACLSYSGETSGRVGVGVNNVVLTTFLTWSS